MQQYNDAVWRNDPAFSGRHFRDNEGCREETRLPHAWCSSCKERWSKDPAFLAYFTKEGQVTPGQYGRFRKEITISDWIEMRNREEDASGEDTLENDEVME